MQDFEGKVAVVTGTANPRGIGIAIARRFAGLGCTVVLTSRPERVVADRIDRVLREFVWLGERGGSRWNA